MSNPIKAVGKVFKKVVKVVKKIALPALAIAAVVLTGGAAIGALPSIGSMLGSIGLSATTGLGAVLSSAAKAATFGAVTSAVMGKNPIKGATMGFLSGGVLGAAGVLANGSGPMSALGFGKSAAEQAALGTAQGAGAGAAGAATTAPLGTLPPVNPTMTPPSLGIDSLAGAAPGSSTLASASGVPTSSLVAGSTSGAGGVAALPGMPAANTATSATGGFFSNPMTAGMMIQGLGSGLSAKAASKDQRRLIDQRRANYDDAGGFFALPENNVGRALPDAGDYYRSRTYGRVQWDPRVRQYVAEGDSQNG